MEAEDVLMEAKESPAAKEGYEAGQKADLNESPYPVQSMNRALWDYGWNLGYVLRPGD